MLVQIQSIRMETTAMLVKCALTLQSRWNFATQHKLEIVAKSYDTSQLIQLKAIISFTLHFCQGSIDFLKECKILFVKNIMADSIVNNLIMY